MLLILSVVGIALMALVASVISKMVKAKRHNNCSCDIELTKVSARPNSEFDFLTSFLTTPVSVAPIYTQTSLDEIVEETTIIPEPYIDEPEQMFSIDLETPRPSERRKILDSTESSPVNTLLDQRCTYLKDFRFPSPISNRSTESLHQLDSGIICFGQAEALV